MYFYHLTKYLIIILNHLIITLNYYYIIILNHLLEYFYHLIRYLIIMLSHLLYYFYKQIIMSNYLFK